MITDRIKILTIFILLFLVSFALLLFSVFKDFKNGVYPDSKYVDTYYKKYSYIKLLGKISAKKSIDGMLYSKYFIDVINCSVEKHDISDSTDNFFLIVNNKKAKMVYTLSNKILVNDIIEINYTTKKLNVFRNGDIVVYSTLPDFTDFFLERQRKSKDW